MTDGIVTRLRKKYAGQLPICNEAAGEIERLRAEVATSERLRLEDGVDSSVYIGALEAETRRLRDEVARLGSFLHPIGTAINGYGSSQAETTWIGADGTITNHDPDTEMGFWVRLLHNECDRSAHLEREIERLRALMTAFVSAWERSELGEHNGAEYFRSVHAMRQAVRGE